MSQDPIIQAFLEEAEELLTQYEDSLLQLEDHPEDAEVLNRIFRAAHTLKGNSGMLGLETMAHFTHKLEDLLDELRKGMRSVNPEIVSVLLKSGDVLKGLVEHARDGSPTVEGRLLEMMDETLARIVGILATKPVAPASATPSAPSPELATALFEIRLDVGADRERPKFDVDAVLAQLATRGRVGDRELAGANAGKPGAPTHRIQFTTAMEKAELEGFLRRCGVADAHVAPVSGLFDEVVEAESVAPIASAAPAPTASTTGAATTRADVPAARATRAGSEGEAKKGPEAASIRVPIEKVDKLINLIGELVITQSMVAQLVNNFSFERLGRERERPHERPDRRLGLRRPHDPGRVDPTAARTRHAAGVPLRPRHGQGRRATRDPARRRAPVALRRRDQVRRRVMTPPGSSDPGRTGHAAPPASFELTRAEYDRFARLIHARVGIQLGDNRIPMLQARLTR